MAKKAAILAFGSPLAGGVFGGEIIVNGERYALVVAPKVEGEKMDLQYKSKSLNKRDAADCDDEGMVNSDLINDANHPAAQFCRGLQIGGFDDWYLPSRDELAIIWRELGPNRKNTPEPFKAGSTEAFEERWYWSSTEHAQTSYLAWMVNFVNGNQSYYNKYDGCGVRAVRRLKL